jgi:hypothetical protein
MLEKAKETSVKEAMEYSASYKRAKTAKKRILTYFENKGMVFEKNAEGECVILSLPILQDGLLSLHTHSIPFFIYR